MSKKKSTEEVVLLGRPGNSLTCGIVGLPNVGKSSFFNVLTEMDVPAMNYAFCTRDPNKARAPVPDEPFEWLCKLYKPMKEEHAYLKVTDIAGLVKGASENRGLGNEFLSHISACDAIFHVLRSFSDEEIIHEEGNVNPVRDLEIIRDELRLKDLELIRKRYHTVKTKYDQGRDRTKEFEKEFKTIEKVYQALEGGKQIRHCVWHMDEVDIVNSLYCLTAKPVIYLINLSEKDFLRKKNKWLSKIKLWVDENGQEPIIPFSVPFEEKIMAMEDAEREAYLKECGTKSMVPKILQTGYKTLNLIHFYTVGEDEVRCWSIRRNTIARNAAGVIHNDMKDGFIQAEVMTFADLQTYGTEAEAKAHGKLRFEGKNYIVQDGDILHFRFNAGAGLTKKKEKKK